MAANGLNSVYTQVNVYDTMSLVVALYLQTHIQTIGIGTLSLADDFAPFSEQRTMGRTLIINHHVLPLFFAWQETFSLQSTQSP
jgi:hypothetical protein